MSPPAQDFRLEVTPYGVLAVCVHCSQRVERERAGQARRAIWEHLKHHHRGEVPGLAQRIKRRRRRFADDREAS